MKYWLTIALFLTTSSFASTPSCWPKQVGGDGTPVVIRTDSTAAAAVWFCPNPYGAPKRILFGGKWVDFVPNWQALGAEIIAGGPSAMATAWLQYVTIEWPIVDGKLQVPAEIYPLLVAALGEAEQKYPLPTAVWKVAPNSTYSTRPAYAVTNGIRSTVGTARASVGSPCYCQTIRFVEGAVTYCAVTANGSWVAVCRKQ